MIDLDGPPNRDRGSGREQESERAQRLIEVALVAGAEIAEVFFKSSSSVRCRIGPLGIRSFEQREERGMALRVWMRDGGRGFVHMDARRERRIGEIVAWAIDSCRRHSGGPLPRLPRKDVAANMDMQAVSAPDSQVVDPDFAPVSGDGSTAPAEDEVREAAHRLIGSFSTLKRGAISLQDGWIESGKASTYVANSRGHVAISRTPVGSAGLWVIEGGAQRPSNEVTSLWYSAAFTDLSGLDPARWVDEAAWRAAASIGGSPVSHRGVLVLLEPRAAAAWVRHLLPHFTGCGSVGSPALNATAFPGRAGLDLIDEQGPIRSDGEGRTVLKRAIVQDGVPSACFFDSCDAEAPESQLGPMRRVSYRDEPAPGPMNLCVVPGAQSRDSILGDLDRGLFVTAITPRSGRGSARFLAEVRGVWVERGKAVRPVAGTLLSMPALPSLSRVAAVGSDLDADPADPPILCPSLLIEGADLVAL